jgi:uncharacterized protein YegL
MQGEAMQSNLPDFQIDMSNPDPRCACVLVLDTSGSMRGTPIAQLNQGMVAFSQDLKRNKLARVRVEIAVVTFGPVRLAQDFVSASHFEPEQYVTTGETPMAGALHFSLDMITMRRMLYRDNGLPYYRPWIFLVTDGAPTDEWQSVAIRIKDAEAHKELSFFSVGVDNADMDMLAQLSIRPPLKLIEYSFIEMFKWLSVSLSTVSHSRIDEQVRLPAPFSWAKPDEKQRKS